MSTKKRELISYLFFGVLTTIVSFIVYLLCTRIFHFEAVPANIVSWIISVTFAYITNRIWVFNSHKTGFKAITLEIASFYASRLFSGLVETLIIYVAVDLMNINDLYVKVVATGVVIVLNYILSKVVVFKKKA